MPLLSTSVGHVPNQYHYTKIISLEASASVNFYGRVIYFKPPRQTRGSDWVMNLIVIDDSFENKLDLQTSSPAGLQVIMFKKSIEEFPDVKEIGDIIQFRHFKTQYYQSSLQAISSNWSAFTVFHQSGPNEWIALPPRTIVPEEIEVLKKISSMNLSLAKDVSFSTEKPASDSNFGTTSLEFMKNHRPTLTICELRQNIFFNGYFKILHTCDDSKDDQISYLVCDYTENSLLSSNPDLIGLPSHLGQCLLPVTLWDNFAYEARRLNLKSGSYVYLDNLVARSVSHANRDVNIVAVLHGDPKAPPSKFIKALQPNDPMIKRLEDQAIRLAQLKTVVASEKNIIAAVNQFSTKSIVADPVIVKRKAKGTFAVSKSTSASVAPSPSSLEFLTTKIDVQDDSLVISSILSVRSYPGDNSKFCVMARINTLLPSDVWTIVRFICGSCNFGTELDRFIENRCCSNCNAPEKTPNSRFIWVFCIIIEDATGDLPIIVADEDAVKFLGTEAFDMIAPENSDRTKAIINTFSALLNSNETEHLFCIQSYRVEADGISCLRYRIFDTRMF